MDVDPLAFRLFDPQVAIGPGRTLNAWGPVYESETGTREVRRLRIGGTRPSGSTPDRWTAVAAHVAALMKPTWGIERIRVTEIGLGDGSFQVLFDGTPKSALAVYDAIALPSLQKIAAARSMTPGYSCKDCKIAGCCGTIEEFEGFLGQRSPGEGTRSVSARDIEVYETCAAQWHMDMSCHLPKERFSGPASDRGRLVHHWIATAHARSQKCSRSDIGDFDEANSFTSTLSAEEYSEVRDYLSRHVDTCPLGEGIQLISTEAPLYGYDKTADVVIASEPDAVYVDTNGALVIRETKTTTRELPKDNREAFDRFFAVPWLLNLFGSGYRGPYHADSGRLELEVISKDESRLYSWDLHDSGVLRMARAEVRLRAKSWHRDTTWAASPGNHCGWCPVRRWCPDAHAGEGYGAHDDELSAGLTGESVN
ncbi:PD-(D/E)XK nuclease family protein [Streptomyces sp. NBC_00555]|uniref:PD-(D/E)XK nuclease family protein n=1 Tax=Streptomyces sp. NBC_00555 TaxID=2903662 RepID=UPI0022578CCC|nr:PD-(D/E)XK nuclease family protein [Streptomyces sp. NBC_00555]MCX5013515.1 PD-(D/E)XK nuclease family protein [Streptomyces sp. NBC_00555]